MTTDPNPHCDCTGAPPWPTMQRLSVGGFNRYYFCVECERVREEVMRPDGTIVETLYHGLESGALSAAAREQAQKILWERSYRQGRLFGE